MRAVPRRARGLPPPLPSARHAAATRVMTRAGRAPPQASVEAPAVSSPVLVLTPGGHLRGRASHANMRESSGGGMSGMSGVVRRLALALQRQRTHRDSESSAMPSRPSVLSGARGQRGLGWAGAACYPG
jgi:hypothetical protein